MGLTGEIMKNVFSKSRSFRTRETHLRNNATERRRWSSVRSYLCGDEFNSVQAQEDSASLRSSEVSLSTTLVDDDSTTSVRGSEATVTQPNLEELTGSGEEQIDVVKEQQQQRFDEESQDSAANMFPKDKDSAAIIIQSAFRSFLDRRQGHCDDQKQGSVAIATGSLSKESIATSIEVQTGNSVGILTSTNKEDGVDAPHRVQLKGARCHSLKLKEDWDDSTVSGNISEMRIRKRLEAMTRRERALAYAFSQQLRICSKKKQGRAGNGSETSMSWSWLERWMATRQQGSSLVDISKQIEEVNGNKKLIVRKRILFQDLAGEEKESCGSNEVSMRFDNVSISRQSSEKDYHKPSRHRPNTRGLSR